jgi:hypothetical protein
VETSFTGPTCCIWRAALGVRGEVRLRPVSVALGVDEHHGGPGLRLAVRGCRFLPTSTQSVVGCSLVNSNVTA